jgi:uncharacterized protein YeaO (DUF488 family)
MIKTKSIFESREVADGKRILITYAWPKNFISQDIDSWIPELGHPWELVANWPKARVTWEEFTKEYHNILQKKRNQPILQSLREQSREHNITLLCTCKIEHRCHRSILKEFLESRQ